MGVLSPFHPNGRTLLSLSLPSLPDRPRVLSLALVDST
jgi:hypothetical protein